MGQRIEEFDLIKGVGIILVVIGHCKISNDLHSAIYSFHMPLFFVVSGYFFYKESITKKFKKTFLHLIIPWVFFVFLNILFSIISKYLSTFNAVESIKSTLSIIDPLNDDCFILYRSIWFLLVLFMVINFYNLISLFFNRVLITLSCIVFYLCGYALQVHVNIPFFIDTTLSVILYYNIGNNMALILNCFYVKFQNRHTCIIAFLVFILCIVCSIYLLPDIDFKYNLYPWWAPFLSLPIIISLLFICKFLSTLNLSFIKAFILKCGFFSLSILGFHRIFQDVFFILLGKIGINWGYPHTFLFVLIAIPLILLVSYFLYLYSPILIGLNKKLKK